MAISKKEVIHLAKLSRMELTEKEIDKFQDQISSVLNYVKKISKAKVKKTSVNKSGSLRDVFRADQPEKCGREQELLDQAPQKKDGYFKVKAVFK